MPTIFTKIVAGDIPSYKLAEDDRHYAFLDISPVCEGHALVIPKRENDYIFDLKDEELADLMVFAKRVALAIDRAIPCKRVGVAVVGLEVPHTHIHLIPLQGGFDVDFARPRMKFSPAEFEATAEKIRAELATDE